jgi:hypothetical protein
VKQLSDCFIDEKNEYKHEQDKVEIENKIELINVEDSNSFVSDSVPTLEVKSSEYE